MTTATSELWVAGQRAMPAWARGRPASSFAPFGELERKPFKAPASAGKQPLYNSIHARLDELFKQFPDAEKDREHLYQVLDYFDQFGRLPEFTIERIQEMSPDVHSGNSSTG
jgi:hypothetical protein